MALTPDNMISRSVPDGMPGGAGFPAPRLQSIEHSQPVRFRAAGPAAIDDMNWKKIVRVLPGRVGVRASNGGSAKRFLEAVVWVAQTRAYWSDIPAEFGNWHTIYIRFGRWCNEGLWPKVIDAMHDLPEMQTALSVMVEKYLTNDYNRRMRRSRLKAAANGN
ncbi:transposase [Pseudoxanthomonas kalamensis]|uniref:transposase n=1 Tax=Pseudoxanthomonas kalamensis TaxID=289483 RepID=UPI0013919D52|nr:transposase [Pseudoxanthomonas kalamensis]